MLIFFIGSYTKMIFSDFGGNGEGIYSVGLDNETGELKILHKTHIVNPAYLVISSDNKYLYSITEVQEKNSPKVVAFKINDDFSLKYINEKDIKGGLPCHISYSNTCVLVSCYETGNVLQFSIDEEGALEDNVKNYQHEGKSINRERQEGPHAHQTTVLSNNKDVFVPDLGIDKLKAYRFKNQILEPNEKADVDISAGEGPRHVVFTKSMSHGYVVGELTGNVSVLKLKQNKYQLLSCHRSLPVKYKRTPSASAIRLHPNNKFLYVANRGLEGISLFQLHDDTLNFIDNFYTNGKTLREFNITPNGLFLIACHQDSNDTVVFKIKARGGLEKVFETKDLLSPVCVTFFNKKDL